MTVPAVPQIFVRSDYCFSQQVIIDSGFWSPSVWKTGQVSDPQGYYCALVGKKYWTIGSHKSCSIVVRDPQISSQHAMLLATADRDIFFCDLQSVNGSFINDTQTIHPVQLLHGDRLRVGPVELEFQHVSSLSPQQSSSHAPKTVLLVQRDRFQGAVWRETLKTYGITTLEDRALQHHFSLPQLEQLLQQIAVTPDLLLADIASLLPNAYEFCRLCCEAYPSLKIILTYSDRPLVYPAERRWAISQGALDALSGFSPENPLSSLSSIVERVNCVLQALGTQRVEPALLEPTLRHLMNRSLISTSDSNALNG